MAPRLLSALAIAVSTIAPSLAWSSPPVQLAWSAPSGCPDAAHVRRELERLLDEPIATEAPPRFTARASVEQGDDGRWHLRLSMALDEAERTLEGDTCEELADATALIIALAVDPVGVAARAGQPAAPHTADETAAVEAPPSPVTPVPRSPRVAAAVVRDPEAPPSTKTRWRGRASGIVDGMALPRAAPGIAVAGIAELGAGRAELTVAYLFSERATLADRSAGGDISLLAGGARLCGLPIRGTYEAGACMGFEGGVMMADAFGVTAPGSGSAPWLAPQVSVLGSYALTDRLALQLALDGLVPLARKRFVLADIGEVYRPPRFTFRAGLGLEVEFR